jgi:hypothetical protein
MNMELKKRLFPRPCDQYLVVEMRVGFSPPPKRGLKDGFRPLSHPVSFHATVCPWSCGGSWVSAVERETIS